MGNSEQGQAGGGEVLSTAEPWVRRGSRNWVISGGRSEDHGWCPDTNAINGGHS